MKLKDTKVGDVVNIPTVINPNGSRSVVLYTEGRILITSLILKQGYSSTVVGWKSGWVYPGGSGSVLLEDDWKLQGIIHACEFNSEVECIMVNGGQLVTASNVDKPCRQCKRPNNRTEKTCWWCCVPNPV